jgi:hypothetical protein
VKALLGIVAAALAGCAAPGPAANCRSELARANAQLQAEIAERQRLVRAGERREEVLRKQLDALKAIERGNLEREERIQTDRK